MPLPAHIGAPPPGAQMVTGAVEALPSVERALVDLDLGELTVEGEADEQAIH